MTEHDEKRPTRRIRMPIDSPEDWVTEQASGPSPTVAAAADWEDAMRRKAIQEGTGG